MKRLLPILVFLLPAVGDDRAEVQDTVEGFLKDLGSMQVEKIAGYFTPKAVMTIVRKTESGFTNSFQTTEEFLRSLKSNPNREPFEEPLSNVEITVDSGQLAHLRADFKFVRDGKVLSTGVDQFTLVKEGAGWKIAAAAKTSIPAPR